YYRKGSVLSLEYDGHSQIMASVVGTQDFPYQVDIHFDAGGLPISRCTCPFTFEPLCKHAVAVLIAWQQMETGSEPALGLLSGAPLASDTERQREAYLAERASLERED